jgi:hypothetical protein
MDLKKLKEYYLKDGIEIVGIFGSFARMENDEFSDIDIAYRLKPLFFEKYKDGFSQIIKIDDVKKELQQKLKRKVDFVPFNEKFEEIEYV